MRHICFATALGVAMITIGSFGSTALLAQEPLVDQSVPPSAEAPVDTRPVINKKSLKIRGYDVAEQKELPGFGPGWTAVLLTLALPEAENEALSSISRLYILDGDRIEFDSFAFDAIEDGIEPSVSTRTFFKMAWDVTMKGRNPVGLVLKGLVPRQSPGDPVRVATRTLVLTWDKKHGFREAVDVVSREPARISGGVLTVPAN